MHKHTYICIQSRNFGNIPCKWLKLHVHKQVYWKLLWRPEAYCSANVTLRYVTCSSLHFSGFKTYSIKLHYICYTGWLVTTIIKFSGPHCDDRSNSSLRIYHPQRWISTFWRNLLPPSSGLKWYGCTLVEYEWQRENVWKEMVTWDTLCHTEPETTCLCTLSCAQQIGCTCWHSLYQIAALQQLVRTTLCCSWDYTSVNLAKYTHSYRKIRDMDGNCTYHHSQLWEDCRTNKLMCSKKHAVA